ncbi:family 20 glycosylhydrolase [Carboxylicivirga sp. M1479]|uniref:beta-N-acetylhexosaminidase n=1 Tax=Carboxylicivirga sp. M1479 TaxID=2594476 RepID=UPI001178A94D|nr:family 20 glycosylhydrolase [Carboxylicivirga sp. M1479]TRX71293.1 family 20 glycosylhydrolase [Carboxylicivirga sp. M1479]
MRTLVLFLILLITPNSFAADLHDYLLPLPQTITLNNGKLMSQKGDIFIQSKASQLNKPLLKILYSLEQTGIKAQLTPLSIAIKPSILKASINDSLKQQAYQLSITTNGIIIQGGSAQGLYYGLLSLQQIGQFAEVVGYWPTLIISDEPDFERRGVMLDISRDKVPSMQTLYSIIDKLASWKINEIQLYTEHTFAYQNHKTVWKDASPMTAEQIKELDHYCSERFIDLVPNQNSFGHMKRWLKHQEYEHLAELPKPGKTIWGMMSRTSLSPVETGSFELMSELYSELLPNFTSQYFNIGCDETVELGVGKSKALCNEIGKGRVYLDFVMKLKKEVDTYGKTTQFWGDIILHHPELIPELPKDMVALIWGYEANYPFDKHCPKFKEAGLPYYVCPGTSTWNTIIGRNSNGFANLKNAAINGKKHGARGFLNTNWGDQGHWQPLSVCYPALLYGAALSWNVENNSNINIAQQVSIQVFNDRTNYSGQALVNLGNAYLKMGAITDNSNIFHQLLKRNKRSIKTDRWLKRTTSHKTTLTINYIQEQMALLSRAELACPDSEIVLQGINQASQLALHSCKLALAKLNTEDGNFSSIPEIEKELLRNELSELIKSHQTIWLLRNREGGLKDSAAKMQAVLRTYN